MSDETAMERERPTDASGLRPPSLRAKRADPRRPTPAGAGRATLVRLGFLVLLLPAGAGVLLSLMGAVLSSMAFDSPRATAQLLPYLIGFGLPLLAVANVLLVLGAIRLVRRGRPGLACGCLIPPALVAVAGLIWMRT